MGTRRVAIIGARGIANYGGFETFVSEVAPALREKGHEVYCSSRRDPAGNSPKEYKGVSILYFPFLFPKSSKLGRVFEILYDWYFAVKCSLVLRCQVIYLLGIAAGPIAWLCRLFGSKVLVNVDGIEWERAKFGLVERVYIRTAFLASCVFSTDLVIDNRKLAGHIPQQFARKAVFIPYGAEVTECIPFDPAAAAKYVRNGGQITASDYLLVVARLEPDNNIDVIVDAYVKSATLRPLVIVGEFSTAGFRRQVLESMRKMQPGKRVVLTGAIYNRRLLTMLRCNSLAYLHGHSVGGTNPSLLEAMAAGNLIIAHGNEFNREVTGDAALYFGDSNQLAAHMDEVSRDRKKFDQLGFKAMARVAESYRWDSIAESYDKLLRELESD